MPPLPPHAHHAIRPPVVCDSGALTHPRDSRADTLRLWQFRSGIWSALATTDLSYNGTYASFTLAPGFNGLAVTAIPEPRTVLFSFTAGLALAMRRRRPKVEGMPTTLRCHDERKL